MPNWCHNTLTATGDEELIAELVKKAEKKQPLSFHQFAPQPENPRDWYGWCLENWGTKWDASFGDAPTLGISHPEDNADMDASQGALGMTHVPGVVIWKFDTAWSPPIPIVKAMSEQFPQLEFVLRYGEPGSNFAGEIKYVDGLLISEEELKVEEVLAPEEMWF